MQGVRRLGNRIKAANLAHMKVAYIAALFIIALLAISAHYFVSTIIDQHIATTQLIEQNNQQKLLAEKIAGYAERYARGDRSIGKFITQDAINFDKQHRNLRYSHMADALGADVVTTIRNIRRDGPQAYDKIVDRFAKSAYKIVDLEPSSLDLQNRVVLLSSFHHKAINRNIDQIIALLKTTNIKQIDKLKRFESGSILAILITLTITGFAIFRPMVQRIQDYVERLERMASTDQLTGLFNLHKFREKASFELERARKTKVPTCMLMIDIDKFKKVNDNYGHMVGDEVIKLFARTLQEQLRASDVVARVGGEEFAVILVDTNLRVGKAIAERIRKAIYIAQVQTQKGPVSVSVSIGLARFAEGADKLEPAMRAADDALYIAKNNGRNQTIMSDPDLIDQTPPNLDEPVRPVNKVGEAA